MSIYQGMKIRQSRLEVAAGKMERAGYAFFLSVNGVWLTKEVPKEYLIKME